VDVMENARPDNIAYDLPAVIAVVMSSIVAITATIAIYLKFILGSRAKV
jgi:hypothetical protein